MTVWHILHSKFFLMTTFASYPHLMSPNAMAVLPFGTECGMVQQTHVRYSPQVSVSLVIMVFALAVIPTVPAEFTACGCTFLP